MNGINIGQARANELQEQYRIFLDAATGHWVLTDGLPDTEITYHIRKTGDQVEAIPDTAFELQHGGYRPGAGRPGRGDGRTSRIIRVALNDGEYQRVIDTTDPNSRREKLLS